MFIKLNVVLNPLISMRTKTGEGNQIRKTCIRERISLGGAVLVK